MSITGVRHAWSFDDSFSAYATQGLDQKTKGVFTREELSRPCQDQCRVAGRNGDFFSNAQSAGGKERFVDSVEYYLDYKDSVLTLHFMLPFKTPVEIQNTDAGNLSIRLTLSISPSRRKIRCR